MNFLVNAFWTVPFLAACGWAQWLDQTTTFLNNLEHRPASAVPETVTGRAAGAPRKSHA